MPTLPPGSVHESFGPTGHRLDRFGGHDAAKDDHAGVVGQAGQRADLGDAHDTEASTTGLVESSGYGPASVAVGVGLDHGENGYGRSYQTLDLTEVRFERVKVYPCSGNACRQVGRIPITAYGYNRVRHRGRLVKAPLWG